MLVTTGYIAYKYDNLHPRVYIVPRIEDFRYIKNILRLN
jgi:hypothetical protein